MITKEKYEQEDDDGTTTSRKRKWVENDIGKDSDLPSYKDTPLTEL